MRSRGTFCRSRDCGWRGWQRGDEWPEPCARTFAELHAQSLNLKLHITDLIPRPRRNPSATSETTNRSPAHLCAPIGELERDGKGLIRRCHVRGDQEAVNKSMPFVHASRCLNPSDSSVRVY